MKENNKIALLNDTHFGCRNFNKSIANNQIMFYENVFFPYIFKNNIKHILHLGDIFDNRESINIKMLHYFKKYFFDVLKDNNIKLTIIIGNHDVAYKNTNKVNSPASILREFPNIEIITEARDININGIDICAIPWINPNNKQNTIDVIKKSKSKICCGHLELSGFKMQKTGVIIKNAELEKTNIFDKFDMVLSGHYHHSSEMGNIKYLGSQYEMTWSDYGDTKYFHILDKDENGIITLEAIENPIKLFKILNYSDEDHSEIDQAIEHNEIVGSFINLVVSSRDNNTNFDICISKILSLQPADLKITDKSTFIERNENIEEININDTKKLLNIYVENTSFEDIESLKGYLNKIYDQAYESQWMGDIDADI